MSLASCIAKVIVLIVCAVPLFTSSASTRKDRIIAKYNTWIEAISNPNDCAKVFHFFYDNPHWPLFQESVKTAEMKIIASTPDDLVIKWFKRYSPRTREGIVAYIDRLLRHEPNYARIYIKQTWILQNLAPEFIVDFRTRYKDYITSIDDAKKAKRLVSLTNVKQLVALKKIVSREIRIYISGFLKKFVNKKTWGYSRSDLVDTDKKHAIVQKLIDQKKYKAAADILMLSNDDEERYGSAFFNQRRHVAFEMLRSGNPKLAYGVMSKYKVDGGPNDERVAKGEWLLGYISYRFLSDSRHAIAHFETAYKNSVNAIRLSKNAFWLAEVHHANGDVLHALEWYTKAAKHPSTFYGYIANMRASSLGGDDIVAAMSNALIPAATEMVFYNRELVQVLLSVPDRSMSRYFYIQLIQEIADPMEELLLLNIATTNDEMAVLIAENAKRQRYFLQSPAYKVLDPSDKAHILKVSKNPCFMSLVHAVIHRESNFRASAVSHAGAVGLMQVMPSTAQYESKRLKFYMGKSLFDRQTNIKLGASILLRLLKKYSNNIVYTIAAYNCGEGNVAKYQRSIRHLKILLILDLIELIPIKETRIYVKHVVRSLFSYSKIFLAGDCYECSSIIQFARFLP
jgi:soluble lytic murein transglycosylase